MGRCEIWFYLQSVQRQVKTQRATLHKVLFFMVYEKTLYKIFNYLSYLKSEHLVMITVHLFGNSSGFQIILAQFSHLMFYFAVSYK